MKEFPRGGLIGKTVRFSRAVSGLHVPLYAANASFFIVLAVFPLLILIVGAMQYTGLDVKILARMLRGVLPSVLMDDAEGLISLTYEKMNGATLGLSAVTMLWSAGRGIYGILKGLNAIYGVDEDRGYLYTRFISMVYTFAFMVVMVLTLGLHVFGSRILSLVRRWQSPVVQFLLKYVDFRFFLLLVLQTGFFTLLFMTLPNRRNKFWDSLPGGLLASIGWLVFSDLFSIYVENFAHLTNVFGSVYAVSLSMLWLYFCMSIVFYGGALNACLARWSGDPG